MRDVLHEIQSTGAIVTLATGRILRSARRFASELGIPGPIVCYQGALIADARTGRFIKHEALDAPVARAALDALHGSTCDVVVFQNDEIYAERTSEWADGYQDRMGLKLNIVGSLHELADREPTLVLAVDEPSRVATLVEKVGLTLGASALVTRSLPHFCEIGAPSAGKSNALEWMRRDLGVPLEETLAFGDGEGDAGMLRWAGRGVAITDGHPDAIKAASQVVDKPEEDGVLNDLLALLEAGEFASAG